MGPSLKNPTTRSPRPGASRGEGQGGGPTAPGPSQNPLPRPSPRFAPLRGARGIQKFFYSRPDQLPRSPRPGASRGEGQGEGPSAGVSHA
jgi:hypothetical protein